MRTHWAGIPGHVFMFVMRHPPAPWSACFQRTGLVSSIRVGGRVPAADDEWAVVSTNVETRIGGFLFVAIALITMDPVWSRLPKFVRFFSVLTLTFRLTADGWETV